MRTPPGAPPEEPPTADRPPSPDDHGPRVTWDEVRDVGRLRRSSTDRRVAGVAGGLGRHLDVDPAILRVAFVVLIFFGGAGLIVYGACWLLVPTDDGTDAPISLDEKSRAVALVAAGAFAALAFLGDALGSNWFPWPLALVAIVGALVYSHRSNRGRPARGEPVGGGPVGDGPVEGGPVDGYPTGYYAEGWYPPPSPRDPRKRGPLLFWYTVLLALTGLGALGTLAAAGVSVPASAYPATVLAACAVMLTVGAFYGRAGGLILLGLVAGVTTMLVTYAGDWAVQATTERPRTSAEVSETYELGVGELVLDLSDVEDLGGLNGREVHVDGRVGRIEVIVPDSGLDVTGQVSVGGPGELHLFGERMGGGSQDDARFDHDGGEDVPTLDLDIKTGVGEIVVRTESERSDR